MLLGCLACVFEHSCETLPVEDVVAKHKAHIIVADKLLANDERLRKSVGRRLHCKCEVHAYLLAVAKESAERRSVLRSGDYENVAYSGKHKHRYWVIHHRLVVDGDKLLRCSLCAGIKACARASCQYYSFHFPEKFMLFVYGRNFFTNPWHHAICCHTLPRSSADSRRLAHRSPRPGCRGSSVLFFQCPR